VETNPEGLSGTADDVLSGADVFIGLSTPGAVTRHGIETMAADAIVFAMANPTPEINPGEIADLAAVVATGRSDYPNQINNVLAFPGVFRGALDIRASTITPGMEIAAGRAIAAAIPSSEIAPDYGVFNRDHLRGTAVADAAVRERARSSRSTPTSWRR
jgi:malate dehydrogenase (oxaloacetate-decarboxylating)